MLYSSTIAPCAGVTFRNDPDACNQGEEGDTGMSITMILFVPPDNTPEVTATADAPDISAKVAPLVEAAHTPKPVESDPVPAGLPMLKIKRARE